MPNMGNLGAMQEQLKKMMGGGGFPGMGGGM
jgi:hypothetical protein